MVWYPRWLFEVNNNKGQEEEEEEEEEEKEEEPLSFVFVFVSLTKRTHAQNSVGSKARMSFGRKKAQEMN